MFKSLCHKSLGGCNRHRSIEPTDLLWKIREVQKEDATLKRTLENDLPSYDVTANRMGLFKNRVCVPDIKDLKN